MGSGGGGGGGGCNSHNMLEMGLYEGRKGLSGV